jgi:hypothetical protein
MGYVTYIQYFWGELAPSVWIYEMLRKTLIQTISCPPVCHQLQVPSLLQGIYSYDDGE